MKKQSPLLWTSFFIPTIYFLLCLVASSDPLPPIKDSEIGYLLTLEDTEIPPPVEKIFILPKQVLPIIDENKDQLLLLANLETGSALCIIPKIPRFSTIIERTDNMKQISFRGPAEVKTIPWTIHKGEELPIERETADSFIALLKRNDFIFPISVAKKSKNFSFSKLSAFAKFAEQKKKEGFVWYDGKWLPEPEAQNLRTQREEKLRKSQQKIKDCINAASLGFIITKDGNVIHGKLHIKDDNALLFEDEDGKLKLFQYTELADMDFSEIVARGYISLARKTLNNMSNLDFSNVGIIRKKCDLALEYLEKVPAKANAETLKQKDEIANFAKEKTQEADEFLRSNGLGLFEYKVFPMETLTYHLQQGHILHHQTCWIKPEQICKRCGGEGKISCPNCGGNGKIREKCTACENGKVKCSICGGTGWKNCPVCKGLGSFSRRCSRCGGCGYISRIVPYRFFDDIEVKDGKVIIKTIPYPWYYYDTIQTCPNCGGSGLIDSKCANCAGTGKVSCPISEPCKQCDGRGWNSKVCLECNGHGKIECKTCGGKGFIGDEQRLPNKPLHKLPDGSGKQP